MVYPRQARRGFYHPSMTHLAVLRGRNRACVFANGGDHRGYLEMLIE